ncbi:tRNA (guanosine(37)-N1)-methyltransferase TrmD [Desulfofustis glycolicus]|uniref:tRNA (guanine-N(1)-)-methyltransferase n=1 Tax=Desulfofustis glycolicus DSM 9705 TaxID=1121409 RepID=A0A1M5VRP0_9BACT|nr:tRNA (guanosine(37)-N1)-methyltransferase TrmD [Desulfofustis glycolicus]MCB2216761.1 tRNA (guanosine(37)-N1)-methyltransferase TrmD [Desulfobulbaceae bacterium]SHH77897.1 tRNA (Guanine37-N(1)-) methyltransferase [Desulfofustis glycolicus DSM 9705]
MIFSVLTIFPDLFDSPLRDGIVGKAIGERKISVDLVNIRQFATDRHATTDDRPYGGGEGMVMKPEPLVRALQQVRTTARPSARVVLLSPQGRLLRQDIAEELVDPSGQLILICGRYEGVDERFRRHVDDEISIGDYVLTGGELAALVIIDAVTRLIPGVLGCRASAENDSFCGNLLKHPQYTRPRVFEGQNVPDVLLSGDHHKIGEHRFLAAVRQTLQRRPQLLAGRQFSAPETALLQRHGLWPEIEALLNRGERQ